MNFFLKIWTLYKNAFGGLSRPAWMLAVIMLINRSGTMVLPFLGLYLTSSLGYNLEQTGIIISCFGVGSMAGSFLGGWLTDKYGHFYVQFLSLVLGGILFLLLANMTDFYTLATGIFILSAVSESFRPANSASVSYYARPENISRAFSLNRMAINLGFSIGPAVGGLLAALSFKWLFIADGTTCIGAGLLFFFYFKNRKGNHPIQQAATEEDNQFKTAYSDYRYLLFTLLSASFAVLFFQLFLSLPLYFKEVYLLNESTIGLLLALNGIIVFLCEMVMVYMLGKNARISELILIGLVLIGLGFIVLNLYSGISVLILAILILSIAEIFSMPFMITYVVQRSGSKNRGSYLGLYSFAFSAGHVLSPLLTTYIIEHAGFAVLWWLSGVFACITGVGFWSVTRK